MKKLYYLFLVFTLIFTGCLLDEDDEETNDGSNTKEVNVITNTDGNLVREDLAVLITYFMDRDDVADQVDNQVNDTDITEGKKSHINYVVEQGIMTAPGSTFSPKTTVTRLDFAKAIYSAFLKSSISNSNLLKAYEDSFKVDLTNISSTYHDAVKFVVGNDLIELGMVADLYDFEQTKVVTLKEAFTYFNSAINIMYSEFGKSDYQNMKIEVGSGSTPDGNDNNNNNNDNTNNNNDNTNNNTGDYPNNPYNLSESQLSIPYDVNHTNIHCTTFTFMDHSGSKEKNAWNSEDCDTAKDENRYFCALPFNYALYSWAYGRSSVNSTLAQSHKNMWVKLTNKATGYTAYVQWEDVGPWFVDDMFYVFDPTGKTRPYAEKLEGQSSYDIYLHGHFAEPDRSSVRNLNINGGGIDISPHAMYYLVNGTGNTTDKQKTSSITVDWSFVRDSDVPTGPWKWNVSTSGNNQNCSTSGSIRGFESMFMIQTEEDPFDHVSTDWMIFK